MYTSPSRFPNQMLTEAEKIEKYGSLEKWAQETVNSLVGIGSQIHYLNQDDTYRKQINYNLVAGYINEDDFKHVTKPYGIKGYNFPATFTNYNIITPKISLLEGEEAARPFNFRVVATGTDTTNEIQRQKTKTMQQLFKNAWIEELQTMGINVEKEEEVAQSTPEEVERYFKTTYKTARETNAQGALEFLSRYCDVVDKFNTGWRDMLITGTEVYWVGIIDGEPVLDVVNPVYFHHDKNPDLKYIEDSAWAWRDFFIPAADVYDKWGSVLTPDQIEKIEQMKGGFGDMTVNNSPVGIPIRYTATDDGTGWRAYNDSSNTFVHVIHCEWKSLKKIGFLRFIDENGEEQETIVDETFKPRKELGQEIDWRWINVVWESTRIGRDIFVNVREKPNQYRNLDNPSKCKLGYVGVLYNSRNSQPYSLVEVMKPHQYLYNIIMYRLELEVARAKGKKMVFDVAQVPRSEGFDLDKWMYYFDVGGIAWINSFEEGKGKFAGQRATFNQFQQIDLSLSRIIDQYIMLLDKIETMVADISGVSRQRQGDVMTSETVGGVERAVRQSSFITESLFFTHNMCKEHVLSSLLEVAKLAWIEGKKINYVMDDMTRILLDIDGVEFNNEEHGIFVSNNAEDDRILESIKQLAEVAMNSGQATLKDLIKIMKAKNIGKAEQILEESYDKAQQQQQQAAQAEQEAAQKQLEMQLQNEQAKMQLEDSLNQRDNDTKIQVAIIQAESAQEAKMPEDKSGELALKAIELEDKRKAKEKELAIKENLARKSHELDRERLSHEKDIDKKVVSGDEKLSKEEIAHKKEIERKKLNLEKNKAEAQRELEKEKFMKELKLKEKQHKEEMAQQEKEHEREIKQQDKENLRDQDTKVEVAKLQPKPKPGSSSK